jgi:ankyrin repeat protein
MICCMNGHVRLLALLSDKGAALDVVSKHNGATATHRAAQSGEAKCLLVMIVKGADINKADVYGYTPLDTAKKFEHPECIALLIASGAVGGRSADGLPPVSEAVEVCIKNSVIFFSVRSFPHILFFTLFLLSFHSFAFFPSSRHS